MASLPHAEADNALASISRWGEHYMSTLGANWNPIVELTIDNPVLRNAIVENIAIILVKIVDNTSVPYKAPKFRADRWRRP